MKKFDCEAFSSAAIQKCRVHGSLEKCLQAACECNDGTGPVVKVSASLSVSFFDVVACATTTGNALSATSG